MIHTAIRWGLVALLLPALVFVGTTPATALIDIWGPAIVANQGVQIGHAISNLGHLLKQYGVLTNQYQQMSDEALGRVGALTQSLRQLSADPAALLDDSAPWAVDFQAPEALRVVNTLNDLKSTGKTLTSYWRQSLGDADQVNESHFDGLYPDNPARAAAAKESWRADREEAERQLAAAYPLGDAAEELTERLALAQASLEQLRSQTNLSGTALQQARLGAQLTDSQLNIATAQLLAYQAARDSLRMHSAELARRRALTDWHDAELATRAQHDASITWLRANAETLGADLLLPEAYSP